MALVALGSARSPRSLGIMNSNRNTVVDNENLGMDLCPLCIQFTDQALNILLNLILRELSYNQFKIYTSRFSF